MGKNPNYIPIKNILESYFADWGVTNNNIRDKWWKLKKTRQLPKILHPLDLNSEYIEDEDDENNGGLLTDLNLESDVEDLDDETGEDKLNLPINIASIVKLLQLICSES